MSGQGEDGCDGGQGKAGRRDAHHSITSFDHFQGIDRMHLEMETPTIEERDKRLVIAIDYGTTYTGIAIATPSGTRAFLDEIDIIQDWGPKMGNHKKIPSVISYSLSQNGEQQWGADVSPNAVAMVHTKLALDVVDNSTELDMILQALDGMHNLDFGYIKNAGGTPKYPRKAPEKIVEDYLTYVFQFLLKAVKSFTEVLRREIPVDIVATIPAEWGYRAKNSTFRALTRAGFNDVTFPKLRKTMIVSEPEAAAIYTARFLKDAARGAEFLGLNECFVMCDAGGGTVDVVSYQVKSLVPFEIETLTLPTGKQCGSIFINLAFKRWLRKLLGDHLYQQLDQGKLSDSIRSHDAEGERMRLLMKEFDKIKKRFKKGQRDIKIELPPPFQNLQLDDRVIEGQIKITYQEMESFFEPCATRIVELIVGQLDEIEDMGYRPRNVLLVGGFAESKYLQESIRESIDIRRLNLHIPDTSWTAVVRGAAILGIEQAANNTLTSMTPCRRSYGVAVSAPFSKIKHNPQDCVIDTLTHIEMAQGQLMWLIKKGDLILSDRAKEVVGVFEINFTETSPRTGTIPVYAYDKEELPDRFYNSRREVEKLYDIEYDLKNIPLQEFIRKPPVGSNPAYYIAPLRLTMKMAPEMLQITLRLGERVIQEASVQQPQSRPISEDSD